MTTKSPSTPSIAANVGRIFWQLGLKSVLAIMVVAIGAMILGWLLGGPARGTRITLTIGNAFRNLGVGLLVASTSFPASKVGAEHASMIVSTIVAVGVVNLIFGLGFAFFMKGRQG
jgi:hypothetical protein